MTTPNYHKKYLKYKQKYLQLKEQQGGFITTNTLLYFISNTKNLESITNNCSGFLKKSDFVQYIGPTYFVYDSKKLLFSNSGNNSEQTNKEIIEAIKKIYENTESNKDKLVEFFNKIYKIECSSDPSSLNLFRYHSKLLVVKEKLWGLYNVCKSYELISTEKCTSKEYKSIDTHAKEEHDKNVAQTKETKARIKAHEEAEAEKARIKEAQRQKLLEIEHAKMIALSRPITSYELSPDAAAAAKESKIEKLRTQQELTTANTMDAKLKAKHMESNRYGTLFNQNTLGHQLFVPN